RRFGVPAFALEELASFASGRFDRLFDRNVQSLDLKRQQVSVRVQLAELYLRSGDSARARDEAMAGLALLERFPPAALRTVDYVRALSAAGQAEAALGHEAQAIDYTKRAVDAARAMLHDIPDGVLARNLLAGTLQRLGALHMRAERPRDAVALFAEAV